jgi:glycosyltransferase involved in cell wall biosynthesis
VSAETAQLCVVMPAFEQAHFIARALEGLLAQTYRDWTLALIDDGSMDETPQIVRPYLRDKRIRYQRLPENRGLGAAINCALDTTCSPYVAYLPADDVWYAEHLRTLLEALACDETAISPMPGSAITTIARRQA